MDSITILGTPIKVSFKIGEGGAPMDEAQIEQSVEDMAALINGKDWPPDFADAFRGMKEIVFFTGKVKINESVVERPGTDEDDAIFYWQAREFLRNLEIDVHANIFFHDCWHIVQFKRAGNKSAVEQDKRVAREVDAITQQIEAGKILGNSPDEIAFLEDFKGDQQKIIDRLKEGIDTGVAHESGGPRR
jgi:hypothetical protein